MNMKRRCLIICPANSAWSYNFLKLMANEMDVTTLSYMTESEEYRTRLEQNGIKIVSNKKLNIPQDNLLNKLRFAIKLLILFMKLREYDVINFQYAEPIYIFIGTLIPGNSKKTIVSYWGSDLYHIKKRHIWLLRHRIDKIKCVTFDNGDLLEEFNKVYRNNNIKKEVVYLPLPLLDIIDEKRKILSKSELHIIDDKLIPTDKIIISVGYNGRRMQNHIPVIESLDKIAPDLKNRLFVIIQATYFFDRGYIDSVIKTLEKAEIPYCLFENYLSEIDVAKIRIVTDVYINAQMTDAFSGSVCEYLYADTQLINANWLRYKEFDVYEFLYHEFDDYGPFICIFITEENSHIIKLQIHHPCPRQ